MDMVSSRDEYPPSRGRNGDHTSKIWLSPRSADGEVSTPSFLVLLFLTPTFSLLLPLCQFAP